MKRITFLLLIAAGTLSLGKGSYMQAKAVLAQWLIEQTWSKRKAGHAPETPWARADMSVVAKLEVSGLKKTLYVMNSDSGQALAFGPGHLPASPLPGDTGHSVVAGHRDSHFEFLDEVQLGDWINTENYRSETARYQVVDTQIIDTRVQQIPIYDNDYLTLVTCYPFDDLVAGGPLRYLVLAEKSSEPGS